LNTLQNIIYLCLVVLCGITAVDGSAQERKVIQFSGFVYTITSGLEIPVPYAGVGILRTRHGTYTNDNGFFSMAAETGDTVLINNIGYKSKQINIPRNLNTESYILKIIIEQDTFQLQAATVYAIPSREHFRPEFLQMDVHDKLKEQAEQNLAPEVLARLEPFTPSDGRAGVSLYFNQEAQKLYYEGQFKPQRIFDAIAWLEFIKAWKRGDFKKKKKNP
jgi:hypothetical protein